MLTSQFVKAIQEAGLPYQKVTNVDRPCEDLSRCSIKVIIGSGSVCYELNEINRMSTANLQEAVSLMKKRLEFENDFSSIPDEG